MGCGLFEKSSDPDVEFVESSFSLFYLIEVYLGSVSDTP